MPAATSAPSASSLIEVESVVVRGHAANTVPRCSRLVPVQPCSPAASCVAELQLVAHLPGLTRDRRPGRTAGRRRRDLHDDRRQARDARGAGDRRGVLRCPQQRFEVRVVDAQARPRPTGGRPRPGARPGSDPASPRSRPSPPSARGNGTPPLVPVHRPASCVVRRSGHVQRATSIRIRSSARPARRS